MDEQRSVSVTLMAVSVVSHVSPLSDLVCREAATVDAGASLAVAVHRMERAGVSALLLEGLRGIVTERDIARALGAGNSPDDLVAAVATPNPVVVPGATTVLQGCAVMLNEQVRHLVVDLGAGLGVVSMRDVMAVLLQTLDPNLWLRSLQSALGAPTEIWLG